MGTVAHGWRRGRGGERVRRPVEAEECRGLDGLDAEPPEDPGDRVDTLGLSTLIAGVDGFGWNRRILRCSPPTRPTWKSSVW